MFEVIDEGIRSELSIWVRLLHEYGSDLSVSREYFLHLLLRWQLSVNCKGYEESGTV